MAASDRFSKLRKAVEKKKGVSKAPEEKAAERKAEKAGEGRPEKREARREREAAPARKPPEPPPEPKKEARRAATEKPKAAAKKPYAKPDTGKKILDTVMADPRLSDYGQVSRVLMASLARKDEVEGKVKSIKEIVDEEVKRILEKQT